MKIVYIPAKDELFEKCFLPKSCVALLGYGYNAKINLDNELRGDTNFIRSLCKLSQSQDITFLCPSYLLCGNKTFFGTIVVDNGKLLGISDATHSLCDNVTPSNAIKVFPTSKGRFGIVSGDDINFFEVSRLLKLWECDCLFFSSLTSPRPQEKILAKAQGYMNETTSIIFGTKSVFCYNHKKCIKRGNLICIETKSEKNLLEKRRKHLYRDIISR